MPQRGPAFRRRRVDQLVGLAGLHDLMALDVAAVAVLREFAIDLLVVGLPEEPDRGVERLCELIARHRPLRQAGKDCVTERQTADPLKSRKTTPCTVGGARSFDQIAALTLCIKLHMRQRA